jgi:hypothetical protein
MFRFTNVLSFVVLIVAINMSVYFTNRSIPVVLHQPRYCEVVSFVRQDTTHEHTYTDNFTCWNFAATFVEHALSRGLQVGLVYIRFLTFSAHTINVFNCTDRGLVFVEPQADAIVTFDKMPDGSTWFEGQPIAWYDIVW